MTRRMLYATACAVAVTAGGAHAQNGSPVDVPAADEQGIIVTAQRRAEALSDVPIAVSAIGAEQLQNAGLTDIRALNQLAPSLVINTGTSEATTAARIRGIGTVGENPGLESSVALFVDGVYRSRTGVGMTDLGEIERIEVLRGPQGTLSGRNATAGTINIVTKGPEFDLGGYGAASYGNYDYLRLEGGVTGPVVDGVLAARLDGSWTKRDGLIEQVTPGEPDINDRDRWMVKGQLLFTPNDDISFRLIGDYTSRDENCCGNAYIAPIQMLTRTSPAGGTPRFGPNPLYSILQGIGANIQLPADNKGYLRRTATTAGRPYTAQMEDWGFSGELNWQLGNTALTSITAYRDYFYSQGVDADFNAADILDISNRDREFRVFSQELRLQGTVLDDRLDWLVGGFYADETLKTSDDVKFGADYEKWANCLVAVQTGQPINTNVPTCTNGALPGGGFGGISTALGASRLPGTGAIANDFEQKSRNYALFTHNVIQIIPSKLLLTLGLRYTNERKTIESSANMNNDLCTKINASPFRTLAALPCLINSTAPSFVRGDPGTRKSEDEWTGTAVLSYHFSDDVMGYASYSRGYKAGGYNLDVNAIDRPCVTTGGTPAQNAACVTQLATAPAFTPLNGRPEATDLQFGSETVDAYEIGLKWDGRMIDVNAALFYQNFNNFQINVFNGINFEVTNLQACKDDLNGADQDNSAATGACAPDRLKPGVVTKGAELEVFAYPADDVQLSTGFTYLDAKYQRNLAGTEGRPLIPNLFQFPGRRTFSSEYSVTGAMTWTPPLSDTLSGLVHIDFRYMSDINTGGDADFEKIQDGYGIINGRIGVYGEDKRWGIELWGQNLLNTKYQTTASDAPSQGSGTYRAVAAPASSGFGATSTQIFLAFPGDPRTFGVTLRTRF